MKRLYHHFINRAVEKRIAAGDKRARGEIRRETMFAMREAYREFKKLITERYSAKRLERWLLNYDASASAKSKVGKLFNRLFGFVQKKFEKRIKKKRKEFRKEKGRRYADKFLLSFIEDQKFTDAKFREYLERFAFFRNPPSRDEKWSAFSSILKAILEYFQLKIEDVAIEAENLWQVSVRGLSETFKTFRGYSDRVSVVRDLRDCVEKIFSFSAYNPAIYIEFVEEDGEFKFDYRYGRDDDARDVFPREPDHSIYQNAKF